MFSGEGVAVFDRVKLIELEGPISLARFHMPLAYLDGWKGFASNRRLRHFALYIPKSLHGRHAPRILSGHVARSRIERGVASILLHHFKRSAGGQRMGNVRVSHPVGTGSTQALSAARIGCIQLGRAGLKEALDLPV